MSLFKREFWEPMVAGERKMVNTLEPKTLKWTFFLKKAAPFLMLEGKYKVTDAGITTGENFQGCVSSFMIQRNKKLIGYAERDTLSAVSEMLSRSAGDQIPIPWDAYSDDLPTTATFKNFSYMFAGPFEPGRYDVELNLISITSEFGGASAFEAHVSLVSGQFVNDVKGPFVSFKGQRAYSELDIATAKRVNAFFIDAGVSDISKVILDGVPLSDIALEMYKRLDGMMDSSGKWTDAVSTTQLNLVMGEKKQVEVTFSTATTFSFAYAMYKNKKSRNRSKKAQPEPELVEFNDIV